MPIYKYKNAKGKELYYVKYNNTTKRGFETKGDAKRYELRMSLENDILPDKTEMPTYRTVAEEYLEYQLENTSYGTYQKSKNLFETFIFPNIEDKEIDKYTELECENFRKCIRSLQNATSYKNNILSRFTGVFKFAIKFHHLESNPARYLVLLPKTFEEKQKSLNMAVWTRDEFSRFIAQVSKPAYRALFVTLYFTGMRLGEALALTWNDLTDHDISISKSLTRKTSNGTYEIKEPKTASSVRSIALNDSLYEYLLDHKDSQKVIPGFSDNWFIFGNINPMAQASIDREKNRAVRLSGVPMIRIHDFRHSHASNLIADGVNIVAVSKRLGHSDINMTLSIYTHLLNRSNDELVRNLEENSKDIFSQIKSHL